MELASKKVGLTARNVGFSHEKVGFWRFERWIEPMESVRDMGLKQEHWQEWLGTYEAGPRSDLNSKRTWFFQQTSGGILFKDYDPAAVIGESIHQPDTMSVQIWEVILNFGLYQYSSLTSHEVEWCSRLWSWSRDGWEMLGNGHWRVRLHAGASAEIQRWVKSTFNLSEWLHSAWGIWRIFVFIVHFCGSAESICVPCVGLSKDLRNSCTWWASHSCPRCLFMRCRKFWIWSWRSWQNI